MKTEIEINEIKAAFFDGMAQLGDINHWDEEELEDMWLLSKTFMRLTTE